jgi:uncharacterized integral membrane protein
MQIFLFFALIIAIVAILFAVQNNETTTVSFIVWDFEGSLALVLLVALAAGALISFFVSLPANIKARWTIRNQRKKLTELESTLDEKSEMLDKANKRNEELEILVEANREKIELINAENETSLMDEDALPAAEEGENQEQVES